VKSVFTVWLPVAAFTTLTVIIIINRRGDDSVVERGGKTNLPSTAVSEAVSTASEFSVVDGDSLKVTFGADIPVSIRLAGIDAPELGQHYGFEAKENLERQLTQNRPEMTFEENGKYGRKVCTLSLDGLNLNLQLVENGFAWASPDVGASFQNAQKMAQERGLGLWSRSTPTPPWEWRAKK
jgi:endonuclease YncB( thermonuclease family)